MDRIVTHIATRECLITQPHPGVECEVVTARRRCQEEGDSTKRSPGGRGLRGGNGEHHMAPITLQRFVQELDKLKQETDAGRLPSRDYDSRLARIIQELRERGLDADRAAATAALADALMRGIITAPVEAHLQTRLRLVA